MAWTLQYKTNSQSSTLSSSIGKNFSFPSVTEFCIAIPTHSVLMTCPVMCCAGLLMWQSYRFKWVPFQLILLNASSPVCWLCTSPSPFMFQWFFPIYCFAMHFPFLFAGCHINAPFPLLGNSKRIDEGIAREMKWMHILSDWFTPATESTNNNSPW